MKVEKTVETVAWSNRILVTVRIWLLRDLKFKAVEVELDNQNMLMTWRMLNGFTSASTKSSPVKSYPTSALKFAPWPRRLAMKPITRLRKWWTLRLSLPRLLKTEELLLWPPLLKRKLPRRERREKLMPHLNKMPRLWTFFLREMMALLTIMITNSLWEHWRKSSLDLSLSVPLGSPTSMPILLKPKSLQFKTRPSPLRSRISKNRDKNLSSTSCMNFLSWERNASVLTTTMCWSRVVALKEETPF